MFPVRRDASHIPQASGSFPVAPRRAGPAQYGPKADALVPIRVFPIRPRSPACARQFERSVLRIAPAWRARSAAAPRNPLNRHAARRAPHPAFGLQLAVLRNRRGIARAPALPRRGPFLFPRAGAGRVPAAREPDRPRASNAPARAAPPTIGRTPERIPRRAGDARDPAPALLFPGSAVILEAFPN